MSTSVSKHRTHGGRHVFLEYLKRTQAETPSFFYGIEGVINEQYPDRNIFWADTTCRSNYSCFGDTVRLDTTYRINGYKVPLVVFSGLNHHGQPILFGCALLLNNEIVDTSYVWLLQTWLNAMCGTNGNSFPLSITTEPDGALQLAVAQVMPMTRHRFCMRSILRETKDKLSHVYQAHPSFEVDFKKSVNECESIDEFESCWASLLGRYDLLDNEWVRSMYDARHQWVPVFMRDTFFGEISNSHDDDDDSISSFFSGFVNSETTLQLFIKQYQSALTSGQEKETKADYETTNTTPVLRTPSPMEKQAADLYTKKIFMKFQGELVETMANPASKIEELGSVTAYHVSKFGDKHKAQTVRFDALEMKANCTCQMFEFSGIICRHILSVFRAKNVLTLPPEYILKRWTKNAKNGCSDDEQVVPLDEFPIDSEELSLAARRSNLKEAALKFVEEGAKSIHVYNAAMEALKEASKKVLISKNQRSGEMQNIGGDASQISAELLHTDVSQNSAKVANNDDSPKFDDYTINEEDRMDYKGSSQFSNTPSFSTQPCTTQPTKPSPTKPSSSKKRKATSILPCRKVWTEAEDVRLCHCWVNVSASKIAGNKQVSTGLWERIAHEYYQDLPQGWVDNRSAENVRHHFGDLAARVKQFQCFLEFELSKNQSDRNEADMISAAEESYAAANNNKSFKDHRAFDVLKDQPIWHTKIGLKTTKKQKSNESASRNTRRDIDIDIDEEVEEVSMSDKLVKPAERKAAKKTTKGESSQSATSESRLAFLQTEQSSEKELLQTDLRKLAKTTSTQAQQDREALDKSIMDMDPNNPTLTAHRRNWILLKQEEIYNRAWNASRNQD